MSKAKENTAAVAVKNIKKNITKVNNKAKEKPVKKNISKAKRTTSLTVREIDPNKTVKDLTMIERELVCKKGDYLIDFNYKGKAWEVSSMWKPNSGAALIQIEAEKAVIDGVKEYDLQGVVNAVAKNSMLNKWLVDNTTSDPTKRIKQICRQWVKHTTDKKVFARLAK